MCEGPVQEITCPDNSNSNFLVGVLGNQLPTADSIAVIPVGILWFQSNVRGHSNEWTSCEMKCPYISNYISTTIISHLVEPCVQDSSKLFQIGIAVGTQLYAINCPNKCNLWIGSEIFSPDNSRWWTSWGVACPDEIPFNTSEVPKVGSALICRTARLVFSGVAEQINSLASVD